MEIKKTYVTNTKFFFQTTVNGKHFDADTEAELVQMVERENECKTDWIATSPDGSNGDKDLKFGQKAWLRFMSFIICNKYHRIIIDGLDEFEFAVPNECIQDRYVKVTVNKEEGRCCVINLPTIAGEYRLRVYTKDVKARA